MYSRSGRSPCSGAARASSPASTSFYEVEGADNDDVAALAGGAACDAGRRARGSPGGSLAVGGTLDVGPTDAVPAGGAPPPQR